MISTTKQPSWYRQAYWRELNDDELDIVEERCKSKRFSSSGMMSRLDFLRDILETDEQTLSDKNITRKQIYDVLHSVYMLGVDEKFSSSIRDRYTTYIKRYNGSQKSPFHHDDDKKYYGYGSGDCDICIERKDNKQTFIFGHLLLDMIRYNGFFEGPGVPYRLDPSTVIDFFNIKPNIDYAITFEPDKRWIDKFSSSHKPTDDNSIFNNMHIYQVDTWEIPDGHIYLTFIDHTFDQKYTGEASKDIMEIASNIIGNRLDYCRTREFCIQYKMSDSEYDEYLKQQKETVFKDIELYKTTGQVYDNSSLQIYVVYDVKHDIHTKYEKIDMNIAGYHLLYDSDYTPYISSYNPKTYQKCSKMNETIGL